MRKRDVIRQLKLCASDPMWSNHAEVSKKLLQSTLVVIYRLEHQVLLRDRRIRQMVKQLVKQSDMVQHKALAEARVSSMRHDSGE